jgi:DNA-binding MarR family transcriptional regulator
MMGRTLRARNKALDGFATNDGQIALRKCLLFMDSFRALRRVMPLQEAYAFLLVASEEGRGVSEYAKCAGVTQAVMTRILFALGSKGRGRRAGYSLVKQARHPKDSRITQTFLTVKGKAFKRGIVRLMRPESPPAMKLRRVLTARSQLDLERDQWLSKLVASGSKLDSDGMKLAVNLLETLMRHHRKTTQRNTAKPL